MLGPTIDDLVSLAQAAGLPKANRRTIRGMVERKLVVSPGRVGRSWRYQNVAIGQVEAVSRHRSLGAASHLIPLVVFVETGIGDLRAIRALACELLQAWEVELAADLARLRGDPSALTAEVARAARMRRDAPLPRRVRARLEDRELAMLYGFAQMLGTPLSDHVAAEGAYQFERLLGLRSGRGGSTRDLSELLPRDHEWRLDPGALAEALARASAERIELARRIAEAMILWMPALHSVMLAELGVTAVPILDILGTWSQEFPPTFYVLMLGAVVSRGLRATDAEVRDGLRELAPETFALAVLSDRPAADWELVANRLRPYQRARLAAVRSTGAAG